MIVPKIKNFIKIFAFKKTPNHRSFFKYIVYLFIFDFIILVISFFIPWLFKIGIYGINLDKYYILSLVLFILLYFIASFSEEIYNEASLLNIRKTVLKSIKAITFAFGVLLVLAFTLKVTANFSRIWGVTWCMLTIVSLLANKLLFLKYIKQTATKGSVGERIVLAGSPEQIGLLNNRLSKTTNNEYRVIGYVCDQNSMNINIPHLGKITSLDKIIDELEIDSVFICEPWHSKGRIQIISKLAMRKAVNLYLSPERFPPVGLQHKQKTFGFISVIEIDKKPIDRWFAFLKRFEDIILASCATLLLLPVIILTAIAIKLESKGPVFFIQPRYGFNNCLINVYKFRSMHSNQSDLNAETLTSKNDTRITKVGRVIRKTSIDELPQLLNVLKGDMSLVGPRPHALKAKAGDKLYNEVVEDYFIRHRVKPGVTGFAQVNGWRGETDTEYKLQKRVEYDLHYIQNWSIFLDLTILIKTIYVVLFSKDNAY